MPVEFGHAARILCDGVAAAHAARDSAHAVVVLKALARGERLVDLVRPDKREEAQALITGLRARAAAGFDAWIQSRHVPAAELERAISAFESTATRYTEQSAREMKPADTGVATLEGVFLASAAANPVFEEDIIVRDIGWALFRAILRAGEDYSSALKGLALGGAPR